MSPRFSFSLLAACLLVQLEAVEIGVGPGKGFTSLEAAFAMAESGDTITVFPRADGTPYPKTAVRITKANISLRGVPDRHGKPPVLDGAGANLSGEGRMPRAIIEFAPGAERGSVTGLRLTNAHNASHNAAGVRINGADGITVTGCIIDTCDMGIFSNGVAGDAKSMRRLTVRDCSIRGNGDPSEPGMSHNLYLCGSSARVVGCLIENSTTGHNLKSRLATLMVEACIIRNSANRELDLVDAAGITDQPGGFALVLGCLIIKDPACAGNRSVIHWGQDGGADRLGTLHLVHCTVVTPFAAPVVELSAPGSQVAFANDIITGPESSDGPRTLIERRGPGLAEPLSTSGIWLSANYAPAPKGNAVVLGAVGAPPPLRDPAAGDWRPAADAGAPLIDGAISLAQVPLPIGALERDHPLLRRPPMVQVYAGKGAVLREVVGAGLDFGAFEAAIEP